MKFQAFKCGCGYQVVTTQDTPKCPDCGKKMVLMETDSTEYKKFDRELKTLFGKNA